jgi:tetratricopeptide (TPR) repeat protein
MKKTLKLMLVAMLAMGMFACGEKKLTYKDMLKAEATLFDEEGYLDTLKAPKVAEKYIKFVEQNPDDTTASLWLYHAMELNVMLKNTEKSMELCDQLVEKYPDSKWAPRGLYLLGSFIYEEEFKDLDKAREVYERIVRDYPECDIIESVNASIKYLGWDPKDIFADMAISQFVWEEESPDSTDTVAK